MTNATFLTRATPFLIFLVVAIFLAVGLTKDPSKLPSNIIDRQMPTFSLPELYSDELVRSETDFVGKVTLLNVFGSWCQGCLVEHPSLMKLGDEKAYDVVGVNWRDTREDAENWLARYGDPYNYIVFDPNSDLAIELGVVAAPETFIIGRNGRIRYKHTGPITEKAFDEIIRPVIVSLVAEKINE